MKRILSWFCLVWVALVVASCSSNSTPTETPKTQLRLVSDFDINWGLEQFEVHTPDNKTAFVPESATVLHPHRTDDLVVGDAAAGKPMTLQIWGVTGAHSRVAYVETTATPKLHETVDVNITLVHVACGENCSEGDKRCTVKGVAECKKTDDACFKWSAEVTACPSTTPACSAGQCGTQCFDECTQNEKKCASGNTWQVCGENDSDPCRDWAEIKACKEGETCENGECKAACEGECKASETKCIGTGLVTCGQFDKDDCLDWSAPKPCGGGQVCSEGACKAPTGCANDCSEGDKKCDGLLWLQCGNHDADQCLEFDPGTSCVPADKCQIGECDAKKGCGSHPVICVDPPKPGCTDASNYATYTPLGSCQEGVCGYTAITAPCPGGCSNGECKGQEGWEKVATDGAPSGRRDATAVWTGKEMIVWGGSDGSKVLNTGGRYDPALNQWVALPESPLAARRYHTAVWTGTEMIVWGGRDDADPNKPVSFDDGARFDLEKNEWKKIAEPKLKEGAFLARYKHTALWTRSLAAPGASYAGEMIIWGGIWAGESQVGAKYDPATDAWTALLVKSGNATADRGSHVAVWTGKAMVVWGGRTTAKDPTDVNTGGVYDPFNEKWTTITTSGAPSARRGHSAVWTGQKMVVWGGVKDTDTLLNDGAIYDPESDKWEPVATSGAPAARSSHRAVWTGAEMIVWGGSIGGPASLKTGGRYSLDGGWKIMAEPADLLPVGRLVGVWTGAKMIVWGGVNESNPATYPNQGGLYTP